jgi:CHAD domain-containing protein
MEFDHETARALGGRLRKVTKRLGEVRELDVVSRLIEEFGRKGLYPRAVLERIGAEVARERRAELKRLAAKVSTHKLEALVRRLESASKESLTQKLALRGPNGGPSERAWRWAVQARVARRAADVRTAMEGAGALFSSRPLHELRIAIKKLRYATELLEETGLSRLTAEIAVLKAAQDRLGRLHDIEALARWGRDAQMGLSPPDLAAWREVAAVVHTMEDNCRWLHARFMRDRPKVMAIVNRLEGSHSMVVPLRVALRPGTRVSWGAAGAATRPTIRSHRR